MMCPVCKRELAPTLSICFTCGAMMNDTVREELKAKVGPVSGSLSVREAPEEFSAPPVMPVAARKMSIETPVMKQPATVAEPPKPAAAPAVAAPAPARSFTSQLPPKKTSPTLVGFQPKASTVPDWRLQVQNAVRQRASGGASESDSADAVSPTLQRAPATHGATALKAEPVNTPQPPVHTNDKVAAALRRIEESRRAFLPAEQAAPAAAKPASRNYPFNVVSRSSDAAVTSASAPAAAKIATTPSAKPKLVSSLRIEKKAYDTNKLPPIPQPAKLSSSFEPAALQSGALAGDEILIGDPADQFEFEGVHETVADKIHVTEEYTDAEEIDDLPTISTRFAAGAFDLILSGAATIVILSPFVFGTSWFSLSGGIAFAATLSILLFLYTTASLTWWGKTFGMRVFSMELIDIEENEYPTVHQAAVSSAVYVLSIAFAGAGFIPVLFNEERRAIHDIVSGTLLVREI
jgi:uncharacterized RDD family membrane protein YckC